MAARKKNSAENFFKNKIKDNINIRSIFSKINDFKINVFILFQQYYESNKFKILFESALRLKKRVLIIKMEEFELNIDKKDEAFPNQIKIYDLSSLQEHNYEGYQTRRLLKDMKTFTGISKSIAVCKYYLFYSYRFKLKNI